VEARLEVEAHIHPADHNHLAVHNPLADHNHLALAASAVASEVVAVVAALAEAAS
jgi:hypothetical protein